MRAPALGAEPDAHLAPLPGPQRERRAGAPAHDAEGGRHGEADLELVDAVLGLDRDRDLDLVALDAALGRAADGDVDLGPRGGGRAGRERDEQRGGDGEELGPAEEEAEERGERGQGGEPREARGRRAGHASAAPAGAAPCSSSSAGGAGTDARTPRTTSSPRTRRTQSSGRSTIRCASAGTAIAFTSSGVT